MGYFALIFVCFHTMECIRMILAFCLWCHGYSKRFQWRMKVMFLWVGYTFTRSLCAKILLKLHSRRQTDIAIFSACIFKKADVYYFLGWRSTITLIGNKTSTIFDIRCLFNKIPMVWIYLFCNPLLIRGYVYPFRLSWINMVRAKIALLVIVSFKWESVTYI